MLLNSLANWETWDPFREINQLQDEMNRVFTNHRDRGAFHSFPQFNVSEGNEGIILTAELPGLDGKDIDISVEGNLLTLTGTKKAPALDEKDVFVKQERSFGEFTRTLKLPFRVEAEKIDARFRNGVLTLRLNRPEDEKPKKITIQSE